MNEIRILIVDDHAMFADGLVSLLKRENGMSVCGVEHTGEGAWTAINELSPDVVLLDIGLPDIDGLEVCRRNKEQGNYSRIIGLSMHDEEAFITSMMENGASGYLLKSSDRKELCQAIKEVHKGSTFFGKKVTDTLINAAINKRSEQKEIKQAEDFDISEREMEVLKLISEELTTNEIAEQLFISNNTVETHRRNLLEKIGARNSAGLIRRAFESGLL